MLHVAFTRREGTGAATRPTSGVNHDVYSPDGGRTWWNNAAAVDVDGEPLIRSARLAFDGVLSLFFRDLPTFERPPPTVRVVDFAVPR